MTRVLTDDEVIKQITNTPYLRAEFESKILVADLRLAIAEELKRAVQDGDLRIESIDDLERIVELQKLLGIL